MKNLIKILAITAIVFVSAPKVWGLEGVIATSEEVRMLKNDLLSGKLQVGQTRLNVIRKNYGDAPNINATDKRITYDYNELKLVIEKNRILKEWEYDGFKKPVYSNAVENLRFDLESGELVGKNIEYTKILRSYGMPTEVEETQEDGMLSVYYYGNIKLSFENQFLLKSWKGQNLGRTSTTNVSEGK